MSTSAPSAPSDLKPPDPIKAIPVRHPGRWVAMAIIGVFGLMFAHSVATNPNWQWDFQWQNAFTPPVLRGVVTTLWLTVAAMLIGVLLGVALAVMRLSPNPVLSVAAWFYVWIFRGTPVLVQLVIWGNLNSLYREISLGVPFGAGVVHLPDPRPDPADRRGAPRPGAQRGRVHVGDHPRRPPVRR